MKMTIIKEFEVGDYCFVIDQEKRKEIKEKCELASNFGTVIEVKPGSDDHSEDEVIALFLRTDNNLMQGKFQAKDLEWYDLLYDYDPETIDVKFGEDLANDFTNSGVYYRAANLATIYGSEEMEVGEYVFDLDYRAEAWVTKNINFANEHENVIGRIKKIEKDSHGFDLAQVNYGTDTIIYRYCYQIGKAIKFPSDDTPLRKQYELTDHDKEILKQLEEIKKNG